MAIAGRNDLPGFRFHPTEKELLDFYLRNAIWGKKSSFDVIGLLDIYRHDPHELPGLTKIHGEREWYFFVPRGGRKHGCAGRPNRTTETGFWKATGSDRKILKSSVDSNNVIGLRKTLVFYKGRAPRGNKTDWIMNEYRMIDSSSHLSKDMVLCKIYRKATSMKVLEQRAAMEEATKVVKASSTLSSPPSPSSPVETVCFSSLNEELRKEVVESGAELKNPTSLRLPPGDDELPHLQLPRFTTDWTQDSFWSQFNSPWFHSLITSPNVMNF